MSESQTWIEFECLNGVVKSTQIGSDSQMLGIDGIKFQYCLHPVFLFQLLFIKINNIFILLSSMYETENQIGRTNIYVEIQPICKIYLSSIQYYLLPGVLLIRWKLLEIWNQSVVLHLENQTNLLSHNGKMLFKCFTSGNTNKSRNGLIM